MSELSEAQRSEALEAAIKSFPGLSGVRTEAIVERAEAFYAFLYEEDEGEQDDPNGEGHDSVDEVNRQGPIFGGNLDLARHEGEPILEWIKRVFPVGAEFPAFSTGQIIELVTAVAQDPTLEVEIYRNPGDIRNGWGISALSRAL